MSESYNTIINADQRDLPSWDGTGVGQDGCSTPTSYNLSAYTGGTPPTGEQRTYEPTKTVTYKPPSKGGGKQWAHARRTGGVRMTPYHVRKVTTNNFLVGVDKLGTSVYGRLAKKLGSHKEGGSCVKYCINKQMQISYLSYTQQGDLGFWLDQGIPVITVSELSASDLQNAKRSSREQAVVKSYKDYDALTELFEFPETARMCMGWARAAVSTLKAFRGKFSLRDLRDTASIPPRNLSYSHKKAWRDISSSWMQYRYGLMPMIYSMSDIVKLMNKYQYTTDKGYESIPVTHLNYEIPSDGRYILKEVSGDIQVRSTVTCSYSTSTLARMSRFGVNPLSTAWELIPYSFVADWFVNVGDYITANLSSSFAQSVGACTSIKTTMTEIWTLFYQNNQTLTRNLTVLPPGNECWPTGSYPWSETYSSTGGGVLREVVTESYTRHPFSRGGSVKLRLNPFLNWKRYVDGTILATNQLRSLMKYIRRGA